MAKYCINKLVLLAFCLSLMNKGTHQVQEEACKGGGLHVKQIATGKTMQNKPEWKVIVSNDCFCGALDVKLFCKNFQTVEKVDPNVFADQGDGTCLVSVFPTEEGFFRPGDNVTFTYVWDTRFPFKVVSHGVSCS